MAVKQNRKKMRKKSASSVKISLPLTGMVFAGTALTASLSFISLPLGGVGLGVFAGALVAYNGWQMRKKWEAQTERTIDNMASTMEDHAYRISSIRKELSSVNAEIRQFQMQVDALKHQPQQARKMPAPPYATARPVDDDIQIKTVRARAEKLYETMPRAVRPGHPVNSAQEDEDDIITINPEPESAGEFDYISDTVVRELIHNALGQNRIDVFVQPIVRLPQRQTRFYEMFARIRAKPGLYIPAERYMKLAEQDHVDARIDELLLLHCLKTIEKSAHIERPAPFFLNIGTQTLHNSGFMRKLLAFLSKNRALAPRLIFEISQSDFNTMTSGVREILKGLGTLGCSFSLDHISDKDFNIAELQNHKVRFVKMRGDMMLKSSERSVDFREMQRIKARLEANGIGVIVEKIENENQMRELLDFEIHFGQGFLFGKPDLQGAYQKARTARPPPTRRSANAA